MPPEHRNGCGCAAPGIGRFFWSESVQLSGAAVAIAGGEIDMSTAAGFAAAVDAAFALDGAVVLDLSAVELISAAGIRIVDRARERARAGGRLLRVVVDRRRSPVRMLEIAGLIGELTLFHRLTDALDAHADSVGETVVIDPARH